MGSGSGWDTQSIDNYLCFFKQIPIPEPKEGQILIKVLAAPINPSDLFFMKGLYDTVLFKITYPSSPGWEGAGIVVKSGGGFFANRTLGKRVAFVRLVENNNEMNAGGCYQQYCLT